MVTFPPLNEKKNKINVILKKKKKPQNFPIPNLPDGKAQRHRYGLSFISWVRAALLISGRKNKNRTRFRWPAYLLTPDE